MISPPTPQAESYDRYRRYREYPDRPVVRRLDLLVFGPLEDPFRPRCCKKDQRSRAHNGPPQEEAVLQTCTTCLLVFIRRPGARQVQAILDVYDPGGLSQPVRGDARQPAQEGINGSPAAGNSERGKGDQ